MSVVHIIFVSLNLKVYTTDEGGGGNSLVQSFVWVEEHTGMYY